MEENDRLVKFLYDGDKVIAERDDTKGLKRYIRGYELVSSDCEQARTYYHYASDELGSITDVLNYKGEVLNHYEYDAFGEFSVREEQVENRFAFAGEQFDPATNLYYLRARFYNPVIGRFIQEDTYYGDGLNLYAYCHNNPVGYVDPSGHDACPQHEKAVKDLEKMGMSSEDAEALYQRIRQENPNAKPSQIRKQAVSERKLMQLGFTAEEARGITRKGRILKNAENGIKGEFVENIMHKMMERQGYSKLESKVGSNNGYDGLYVLKDSQGNVTKVVIGEAKYGNSRLGQTSMGKQMVDHRWIIGNLMKMEDSNNKNVKKAFNRTVKMIKSKNYEKFVFRIRRNGNVSYNKL